MYNAVTTPLVYKYLYEMIMRARGAFVLLWDVCCHGLSCTDVLQL